MSESVAKKPNALRRVLFFLKFLEIRLRFILILIVTALVVGYWDYVENYYERWTRADYKAAGTANDATSSTVEYYCGMHPFVVRDRPGKCPICGMDLSQRAKGAPVELPDGAIARVQTSPDRIMQAGVQVQPVLYRLLSRVVRSYGIIEVAETKQADVIARFPGRVEELMVNATGMPIRKGEPLARIYSPEFLQGALEYVRALNSLREIEGAANTDEQALSRAKRLVDAAYKRLSLAGFTDEQLSAIAKTGAETNAVTLFSPVTGTIMKKNVVVGQNVEVGTAIYSIAELSTLWVQVQVIESEIGAIHDGMPVEVTSVAWPGEIFYGTVDFLYPEVDPESRSLKVRVSVDNTDGKLRPGMYVNAVMRAPMGAYGPAEAIAKSVDAPASGAPGEPVALPTTTPEAARRYLDSLPDGASYYTCTMDPEVVSDKPGDCPVCQMHLVSRTAGEKLRFAKTDVSALSFPTANMDDAGVFLASLPDGADYYLCPMDPEVVSNSPDTCPKCNMKLELAQKAPAVHVEQEEGPRAGSYEQWAEGYTCPMHPEELNPTPGVCTECGCGMKTSLLRVERVLSIPESAVIDTGAQHVVYVESMPGVYDAHAVTLGSRSGAFYPILAGLELGQRIVTQGAFLIDAEARLNPTTAVARMNPTSGSAETEQKDAHAHSH